MNPRRPLLVSPLMRCLVASGAQVAQWQYSNAKLTTAGLTVWERITHQIIRYWSFSYL